MSEQWIVKNLTARTLCFERHAVPDLEPYAKIDLLHYMSGPAIQNSPQINKNDRTQPYLLF